jgi:hypothetical protein
MHPRNKMRLLAGVPMDPELERTLTKPVEIKEQVDSFIEEGESLIDEAMDPYKALDGAMQAIQSVLKHLEQQMHIYHGNQAVVKTDKKDHAAYERILALLHKGNMAQAKHTYHEMDTAAREHLGDVEVVPKKAQRKAAATLFGYHLLHEGVGMDMLLGRKGKRAVRKLLRPDIEKAALTLYQFLRQKGREAVDARHAAASSFGLDDRTFMDVLMDAGIHEDEEQTEDPITEDHFDTGAHVIDKGGKVWEVTGSDEGEGDEEVYDLKDIGSGEASSDIAENLRKVTKESVEYFLAEYNYTGGGEIKSKLLALYKMDPNAYREIKPKLEEMFHSGGDTKRIEYEIEAKMAEIRGVQESMHDYEDKYEDFEDDEEKPVNVADGSSNDEQVYDDMERKPESPHQLKEPGGLSNQNVTDYDLDKKMAVPANIKSALKKEADKARAEAQKLDIRDRNSAYFYRDLARAFDDLRGHLEKGTVYDVKQAQTFAQTLMGPMLHKIPNEVWKWLTNAGKTRSLKDYMKDVGDPTKIYKKGIGTSAGNAK